MDFLLTRTASRQSSDVDDQLACDTSGEASRAEATASSSEGSMAVLTSVAASSVTSSERSLTSISRTG